MKCTVCVCVFSRTLEEESKLPLNNDQSKAYRLLRQKLVPNLAKSPVV